MRLLRYLAVVLVAVAAALTAPVAASAAGSPHLEFNTPNHPATCLGVRGSVFSQRAVIGGCQSDSKTQQWVQGPAITIGGVGGYVHLRNALGACLGISGASQAYYAAAVTGLCQDENDHSQYWKPIAIPDSGGWFELKNGHSGLCLTGYLSVTDELDQNECYGVHYPSIEWRPYAM